MKPANVKPSVYIDFGAEDRNIFSKCYTPNRPEEVFVIKKVKNTVKGHRQ